MKVARIFNTHGPRVQIGDGRVDSNFIVQALSCEPLTIDGGGSQTRPFGYVDDLVDGLIRLMGSDATVTAPINLGHTAEIGIKRLAEIVISMTGSESQINCCDLPENDPGRRRPEITAARNLLEWEPATPLSSGPSSTVVYFRQRMGI